MKQKEKYDTIWSHTEQNIKACLWVVMHTRHILKCKSIICYVGGELSWTFTQKNSSVFSQQLVTILAFFLVLDWYPIPSWESGHPYLKALNPYSSSFQADKKAFCLYERNVLVGHTESVCFNYAEMFCQKSVQLRFGVRIWSLALWMEHRWHFPSSMSCYTDVRARLWPACSYQWCIRETRVKVNGSGGVILFYSLRGHFMYTGLNVTFNGNLW